MNNAILIQNLSKRFGNVLVLNHINVCFEAGRIHGIVGRNGSGKTVLMKCILGFLHPTEGSVSVFGRQIGQDCDFAPDTGMIIETPGFLLDESGRSNLDWLLRLSGRSTFPSALPKPSTPPKRFPLSGTPDQIVSPSDPAEALAAPAHTGRHSRKEAVSAAMRLVGLDPDSRKPVGHYSLGMHQRLGIAQALLEQPRLLVLDEPMNGLDNQSVSEMRQLFLSLRENGVTILMASHNPLDITSLCDRVYEMDGGILSPYLNFIS